MKPLMVFLASLPLSLLVAAEAGADREPPRTVSPGGDHVLSLADRCPTFSWATVAGAESYDLRVFAVAGVPGRSAASPGGPPPGAALKVSIPGGASSWTPALEQCLVAGGAYGWVLRSVVGGRPGRWSEPRLFRVTSLEENAGARRTGELPTAPLARAPGSPSIGRGGAAVPDGGHPVAAVGPPAKAPASQPQLSVERSDGGFLLAEFRNRATSGDRSGLLDIVNGNTTATTWRLGVGGAGNGFGLTSGELYVERVGAGIAMLIDDSGAIASTGYPAFVGRFQSSGGCAQGVLCGRTGLANSSAIIGEAASSGSRGVLGTSTGANGQGVLGATYASGGIGVKGYSSVFDGVPAEFELDDMPGDLVIGKTLGSAVFRVDYLGKGFFDGGTQVGGADFAEAMAVVGAADDYEPGDVMAIDRDGRRRLVRAARPYTTAVAGVVSTDPGVLATRHGMDSPPVEPEIPLAIMGIVPCKVSAENGPVRPGDLLVASSTPGHAMRAGRRRRLAGAVLGKALEPLASGAGRIEVLLTLR